MTGPADPRTGSARRVGAGGGEPPPPRLAVRDLRVKRGGRIVLDGMSLEVARGEVFGLLGPNGAGKTTAFQVLVGLLEPEGGELFFDGAPLCPSSASFRSKIGVVFQEPALDPRLTPLENLVFAAALFGVPASRARERAQELLDLAGLRDRAGEPAGRLSGGMKRRVEILRALVHGPALLILDEPTTGLDEAAFRSIWEHLLSLRRERGLTLLLTTHRAEEAERCDRLGVLHQGTIIACDTPDGLRERVRGDLIVLETADAGAVAAEIARRLGVPARPHDGKVLLERERGHELVPRLVEAFPHGTLKAVSLRRPGLAEAFLALTGRELEQDTPAGGES